MRKKEGFANQKMFVLPESIIKDLVTNKVTANLYFTDIGYFPKAEHHYRERKEGAMQNILIYCTEGEGWFELEQKQFKLKKNQYFFVEKDIPHRYGSGITDPWSIYWVHFAGLTTEKLVTQFNSVQGLENSSNQRFDARISLFDEIFHNLEMGYTIENIEYSCLCLLHILGSLKYVRQFRRINAMNKPDVASKAIGYMKDNIHRKIYLNDIASYCGLSVSQFCSVFKRTTSRPPMDYLLRLRVQYACALLDFSGWKIKEVAQRAGFEDQFYFSRVFIKIMGQSPTAYRKVKKG